MNISELLVINMNISELLVINMSISELILILLLTLWIIDIVAHL